MFADFVFVWYNIHKDRIRDLRQRDVISAPNRFQSIDFPKIYQMNGIPKKSSFLGAIEKGRENRSSDGFLEPCLR